MNRRGFFIEAVRVAETWLPTIIPQSTEWQAIGNQIKAATIFTRSNLEATFLKLGSGPFGVGRVVVTVHFGGGRITAVGITGCYRRRWRLFRSADEASGKY